MPFYTHRYNKFTAGIVQEIEKQYEMKVAPKRKTGLMMVGLAGNNGSTVFGSVLAKKLGLTWGYSDDRKTPTFLGSIYESGSINLGFDSNTNRQRYEPIKNLIDGLDIQNVPISGWDISNKSIYQAMLDAKVLPSELVESLKPHTEFQQAMPSILYEGFAASNQSERANNILSGNIACWDHVKHIMNDIQLFKDSNQLEHVVVVWTASTERMVDTNNIHQCHKQLIQAIKNGTNYESISPSMIFAVASILSGCTFFNGSPQNTLVPAIINLAKKNNVHVGGSDFKSGQTKLKSCLTEFLISSGMSPKSIVSYNHLGNNDGLESIKTSTT